MFRIYLTKLYISDFKGVQATAKAIWEHMTKVCERTGNKEAIGMYLNLLSTTYWLQGTGVLLPAFVPRISCL